MQKITPFLWFESGAKEAAAFYLSVFGDKSKVADHAKLDGTPSGQVEIITFNILGQDFTLMSAGPFRKFNEAISFVISCDTEEEVDHYWDSLSAVKEAEQCGWLKDKYGVSWQVVPKGMQALIGGPDKASAKRAMDAMLKMKKLDLSVLKKAYDGV